MATGSIPARRAVTFAPQGATLATTAVIIFTIVAVVCWAIMYPAYSLADHYFTPDFAFDKIPDHFNSPILRWTTFLMLVISACYACVYTLLRAAPRVTGLMKTAISAGVVLTVILNVLLYPVGALDVYNYVLELKIAFFYHQNPYLTTFASFASDPAGQYGFFNNVPLFYGPIWLFLAAAPTLLTGFGDTQAVMLGLKLENVVFLAITIVAIYKYQLSDRSRWIAVYLFAANPLIVFEAVGNAHNDIMMTCFLVLAVLALKDRSSLAVPLLAFSALIKFFSAALFPLFVLEMIVNRWSIRRIVVSCLIALALVIGITLPVWAGGQMLVGLASGVSVAQSLSVASLFSVVREYLRVTNSATEVVSSVQWVFTALFGLSVLLVTFRVWRGARFESGLIDTFLLFAVLVSLLTPWYLLPALGLIALAGDALHIEYLIVATCLGLLYYPLSVWAWFDAGISTFQVHLFQAVLLTLPILVLFAIKLVKVKRRASIVAV